MVDDEEGFTRLAAMTLTDYEIRGENDSARALAAAQEFKPDLILLDVMMPGLDGGDVAAQIRAEPRLRNVPIIFLTAMVTEGETAARRDVGGFLSSPSRSPRSASPIASKSTSVVRLEAPRPDAGEIKADFRGGFQLTFPRRRPERRISAPAGFTNPGSTALIRSS